MNLVGLMEKYLVEMKEDLMDCSRDCQMVETMDDLMAAKMVQN